MILVLTNKEDPHADKVIKQISQKGKGIFRINTESILTDYKFFWSSDNDGESFYIKNIHNNYQINLDDISAVWYRRPVAPTELPEDVDNTFSEICLVEADGFLDFLYYFLKDKFWIGNPYYYNFSSSKMLQLKIAKQVGFVTPKTMFSNNKNFLKDFFETDNKLVVKSIESPGMLIDESSYTFFTHLVSKEQLFIQNDLAFASTVSFIQPYIEKSFELRVTVIEDQIFACKINSQESEEENVKIDFRSQYDYEKLKHESFNLPKEISDKCFNYLKEFNINFGCFDFIVTPKNEYLFLECNPNGQWLWIEIETGLDISGGIVRTLLKADERIF